MGTAETPGQQPAASSEQLTPLNDTPVHVTFLPTHHSFQDLKIKDKKGH